MKLPILTRTDNAMPWGVLPLTFLDGPHSAYGVCIFLNKPSFTKKKKGGEGIIFPSTKGHGKIKALRYKCMVSS